MFVGIGIPLRFSSSVGGDWWEALYSGSNMACDFAGNKYMDEEVEVTIGNLLSITRASGGTATTSAGVVTKFPSNDTFRRTDLGLRSEVARTNLQEESEDFNDATWSLLNATIDTGVTTGPDGVSNSADRLIDDNGGGSSIVRVGSGGLVATTSDTYTYSVFAKADQLDWLIMQPEGWTVPATDNTSFDLTNGVVGNTGVGHTARIEAFVDDWYRCSVTFTVDTDVNGTVNLYIGEADDDNTVPRDLTSSIFLYGGQFELGDWPSSYIPTETVAVTRAQDDISFSDTDWYTPTIGTIFTKTVGLEDNANARIFGTDAADESGPLNIRGSVGGTTISRWNGSSSIHAIIGGSGNVSGTVKAAMAFNADPHSS